MLSPRFIPQSVFYTHGPLSAVRCPQSAVRSPQSAVRSPQSAVRSPQSAVRSPQSAVRSPQSAVRSPQSAVRSPQSAVRSPQSAVRSPQSAVRSPQSAVRSPQSAVRSPQSAVRSAVGSRQSTVHSPQPTAGNRQSTVYVLYWPEPYGFGPCKSTQTLPVHVPAICETACLYYQNLDNYSVYEHDFKSTWLWGNSYWAFSLPKQWNGGHVGVPKQPWGSWTLFLGRYFRWVHATYFTHRNQGQQVKLHKSTFDLLPTS